MFMSSIERLKQHVKGFARASKYEIVISHDFITQTAYQFLASATEIPALTYGVIAAKRWGMTKNIAGTIDYDPVDITFYMDVDFTVYNAFLAWADQVANREKIVFNFYDNYVKNITFKLFDDDENVKQQVQLVNAWPSKISSYQLGWNKTDEFLEFDVTFEYERVKFNVKDL
jgi:hypothetical protein